MRDFLIRAFPWAFEWRVQYRPGEYSVVMPYHTAKDYAEIFSGTLCRPEEFQR